MDRKFILTAFGYAILGLSLGIFMAASKNHGQHVTHAHIMLIGFLLSFTYGLCHKLWLNNSVSKLAIVQFYVPLPVRALGSVAALLFAATAMQVFAGRSLTPLSEPLPFFAYPVFVLTLFGWAWWCRRPAPQR